MNAEENRRWLEKIERRQRSKWYWGYLQDGVNEAIDRRGGVNSFFRVVDAIEQVVGWERRRRYGVDVALAIHEDEVDDFVVEEVCGGGFGCMGEERGEIVLQSLTRLGCSNWWTVAHLSRHVYRGWRGRYFLKPDVYRSLPISFRHWARAERRRIRRGGRTLYQEVRWQRKQEWEAEEKRRQERQEWRDLMEMVAEIKRESLRQRRLSLRPSRRRASGVRSSSGTSYRP